MSYQRELRAALSWVDETDAIALSHFGMAVETEDKADGTPVTAGDRAVEQALRAFIQRDFPADAILGEEHGASGSAARTWIVDPIDGTKNYARGIPVWATLIALMIDGRSVLGVVSAPALGARWWASAGEGAFRDGALLRVSTIATVAEADVITGGITWAGDRLDGLLGLLRGARRSRGFGDFWGHMMVAQGSAEAMVELAPLALWDIAAPKIIVEEAGGRVTGLGGEAALRAGPVVSTNGAVHDEVLGALR